MSIVLRMVPGLIIKSFLLLAMFAGAACAQSNGVSGGKSENSVVIESANGSHRFNVELARSPEERQVGLMYRETLAADAGMLFDFGETQPITMWMKNTLISLDMAFIDETGEIKSIASRTTPLSLQPISSGAPVVAVLEVKGGAFESLGVKAGDKVRHPMFKKPQ